MRKNLLVGRIEISLIEINGIKDRKTISQSPGTRTFHIHIPVKNPPSRGDDVSGIGTFKVKITLEILAQVVDES